MRLEGKVAVITGGTQGIGRASAELFAREGARVVVTGRTKEHGEETVDCIKKSGGEAYYYQGDVTKVDDLKGMIDKAVELYGKLDILFNNAGTTGLNAFLADVSEEEWDYEINTGLKSYFMATKFAIPVMMSNGGGSIINNSSVAGLHAIMMRSVYNVMKGGMVLLTKNIALDYGPYGIRANCICTGAIYTPASERYLESLGGEMAEKVKGLVCSMIPMGRYGTPEELGNVALFLASDESSYVNGAVITVDGGGSAGYKLDLSKLE